MARRWILAACAIVLGLGTSRPASAQQPRMTQDPSLDNLVHAPGYVTAPAESLGKVRRVGHGPQPMILIAGAGFGGEVFDSFMARRMERHTFFVVTLPGFGGTPAPPMPPPGTSYGEQTWSKAAQAAIARLIDANGIDRPIVVAHWLTASEIALRLALDRPDRVRAVVIISGAPKRVSLDPKASPEPASLAERVRQVDAGFAPHWFKTVTRDTWDDNNYLPGDYAKHPIRALQLWREAASPPLPVRVRYLLEQWAQDVTLELGQLEVPTLVLKPGFDEDFWHPEGRDYMRAFCHESWRGLEGTNPHLRFRTIPGARAFIMDDEPRALDREVDQFLAEVAKP